MKKIILNSYRLIKHYVSHQKELYLTINNLVESAMKNLTALLGGVHKANIYGVIKQIEDILARVEALEGVAYYCSTGHYCAQYQKNHESSMAKIQQLYAMIFKSPLLRRSLEESVPKTQQQKSIKDCYMQRLLKYGNKLNKAKSKGLSQIMKKLQSLELKFNRNLYKSEQYWNGKNKDKLNFTNLKRIMVNEKDASYRERFYRAYYARASRHFPCKKFDNESVMHEMLSLRYQYARLLEHNSYAEMAISHNAQHHYDDVVAVLNAMATVEREKAGNLFNKIFSYAKQFDNVDKINPWDFDFYVESYLKYRYFNYQSNQKAYFKLEDAVGILLQICRNYYGLEITVAHRNGVNILHLYRRNKLMAIIYLDLLSRDNKQNIIWTAPVASQHHFVNGDRVVPETLVQMNINKQPGDNDYYLSLETLIVLFHEFGHALHSSLAHEASVSLSGMNNCTLDVLEFPSQYMENYCLNISVLNKLCKSQLNGRLILPGELDSLLECYQLKQCFDQLFQLQLGLFDISLHKQTDYCDFDVEGFYQKTVKGLAIIEPCEASAFTHGFFHAFSNQYAANYHTYMLSQIKARHYFQQNNALDVFK